MIIEFNEEDYNSIQCTIARLCKIRKRILKSNPLSVTSYNKDNVRWEAHLKSIERAYNTIKDIYNTDISSLYDTGTNKEFYVYVHCNPINQLSVKKDEKHMFSVLDLGLSFEPFYVGKGIDNRCYDLNRNEGHRKIKQMVESVSKEVVVIKIKENLYEHEALALESKLIDIFGLKSLCQYNFLVNLDEGKCPIERRKLYPKGSKWYLNRNKMVLYNYK